MNELDGSRMQSLIFDLDGTLWDTTATCAGAWNKVLRRHDIEFREITARDVAGVTGRPHEEAIRMPVIASVELEDRRALRDGARECWPLRTGGTFTIDFTPDAPGRFPILCSVFCGDGHDDMTGVLVVRAREKVD